MRTCIVTGANSGIGKCAAAQLAANGFRVIMACRNMEQAEAVCAEIRVSSGNEQVFARRVDLSLVGDAVRFADEFIQEFGALDVLINNAADFDISRRHPLITPEGNEAQFATNLLSPFVLMQKLQPLLQAAPGARIINIASKGLMAFPNLKFRFDRIHGEGRYSPTGTYYQTKLGLLMVSLAWRRRFAGLGVSIHAVRVANVKVDIARYPNLSALQKAAYRLKSRLSISPERMALAYTELATGTQRDGFYYDENLREVRCNKTAYDEAAQEHLWRLCERASMMACGDKSLLTESL